MVKISIRPSSLVFREIPVDLLLQLQEDYQLDIVKGGYQITGKPTELYNLLFKIAYTYDIELS